MSEKTDNDRLAMVTEMIGGADAPPVTVDEFYETIKQGHSDHIHDIESQGRRVFERVIELERAIGQTMFGSPNGGFCFPDEGSLFQDAVYFLRGTDRISLSKAQRECSKSGVEVLGTIVQCVLDYRGVDAEKATIEVVQNGEGMSFVPRLFDAVQTGINHQAMQVEVLNDTEEGLLLGEMVDTRVIPLSKAPKKRGKIKEWKGLPVAHNVTGLFGEDGEKIGDQTLIIKDAQDVLLRSVEGSEFDARVKSLGDRERMSHLAMALERRTSMSGQQIVRFLGQRTDLKRNDNGRRWELDNISRVNDAFLGVRAAMIRLKNGMIANLFAADVRKAKDDPLQSIYTIGRAPWLDEIRRRKEGGGRVAAFRLSGCLFWRTATTKGLSPLAMRFLTTAERLITNSPLVQDGRGGLIPILLHPDNRAWQWVDFSEWCKAAKIDYDDTIRPTWKNNVRTKLQTALASAVDFTRNNATTVEFSEAPKRRGSGAMLGFRASAKFVRFHRKKHKHEDLLCRMALTDFLGDLDE